jgi:hypothetical protein
MPHLAHIAGCGPMACSSYEEMTAAIDRIYAVAEDQPIAFGAAVADLAAQARQPVATPRPRVGLKPEP